MSDRSEVVSCALIAESQTSAILCTEPLGVLLHNENKLDEMSMILVRFVALVPTLPQKGKLTLPKWEPA